MVIFVMTGAGYMHKIYDVLFILFLIPCHINAQGEFNNWYFGMMPFAVGVTFNPGFPVPLPGGVMYAVNANISVSDSLGNLLFYSDQSIVYNKNMSIMPNGANIKGEGTFYNQPILAVQKLDDDSSYFIFTVGMYYPPGSGGGSTRGLEYSIVNMRLDGGLGDIEPGIKNIPVTEDTTSWIAVTGARHADNKDIWVVTTLTSLDSLFYTAYLITRNGLDAVPVKSQSFGNGKFLPPNLAYMSPPSSIIISPNGTKLVALFAKPEYCVFNSSTGKVTRLFSIPTGLQESNSGLGQVCAEFSIDSKLLYLSLHYSGTPGTILQFDATKTDSVQFMQSRILIDSGNDQTYLQMGPDWKIYGSEKYADSLCIIQNPSSEGSGCNYLRNAVGLNGPSGVGLPQFVQRYKAYIHHDGQCQWDSVHFSSDIWPPADSIHWDFGDPTSGTDNFSNQAAPAHIYSNVGTYTVTLFVRHNDNRTDTSWQSITILPGVDPELGPNRTVCIGDSTTFDAGACGGCTYQWKNLGTGLIVGTGQTYKTGLADTYSVIVTNSNSCTGSDTVQLFTTPVPSVTNNPLSESICSGDSTYIVLTSSVPGTIFHWTANLTSGNISGFSADSGLIINQILVDNILSPGVVTYHITPKVGSCTGSTVDYQVTVTPGAPVSVGITPSQNNVCAGTSVTYTAVPTNGGANPAYQWKVNGINSGTNSNTFTYTPANNDVVTCVLTSSLLVCISNNPATSNAITMTVNPLLPVSVNIAPSQNPVCSGASITFTATPTNGGTSPTYQWKVNGTGAGTNSSTYTYTPVNGDIVTCVLTSNATCPTGNPATSNTVTMTVNPSFTLSLTIAASDNPFCPGALITFTATPTNGGTSPTYQWKVNGINAGTNSSTYSYPPNNGDSIRCIITSNLSCDTNNPASSVDIIMSGNLAPIVTFTSCFDTITTVNAKPIKLKGGIPLGGIYSGPGVNSLTGIFTPSTAGTGTKTITYSYTNVSTCSASKTIHIIVQATPIFTCGNTLNDIRDNTTYATIQIGSQCWMAANLNYGTILVSTQDQRDNCLFEKYCYNDNPANCTNLGALYQWDEMMQYDNTPADQGFCPPGWHIPSETDWNTLFAVYTNNGFSGSPLKFSGFSGFNALLAGENYYNTSWDFQGFATFFWSSTTYGGYKAWAHGMNDPDPSVSVYPATRVSAFLGEMFKRLACAMSAKQRRAHTL